MSIAPDQLREYIVRPSLKAIDLHSKAAEELIMLTAATETMCGAYIHQVKGPALGIYQMEPATYKDIWRNYLSYNHSLADNIAGLGKGAECLAGNLYYATAMARVHYLRVPSALPHYLDEYGLAKYWKDHYNTHLGKGTVEKAVQMYRRYALGN